MLSCLIWVLFKFYLPLLPATTAITTTGNNSKYICMSSQVVPYPIGLRPLSLNTLPSPVKISFQTHPSLACINSISSINIWSTAWQLNVSYGGPRLVSVTRHSLLPVFSCRCSPATDLYYFYLHIFKSYLNHVANDELASPNDSKFRWTALRYYCIGLWT